MWAMVLEEIKAPLVRREVDYPQPQGTDVHVRVEACGVCRTDLHVIDGELPDVRTPLVPGHEVVGRVVGAGPEVRTLAIGQRVGIPWLGGTCGICEFCGTGHENLCDAPGFTGYTLPGGYASHIVANSDYCIALAADADPVATAPLLCAGLIGWRSFKRAGAARRIGLYGFGAAAHIVAQIATAESREVFAFTRPDDVDGQAFARSLGAVWAGSSLERPPVLLDAAIIFAPVGPLVVDALHAVKKGGRVICGGIHMSDIPGFEYAALWGERELVSIANLTRQDAVDFFAHVQASPIRTTTTTYPLERANAALSDLRAGSLHGAAVLIPQVR